MPKSNAPFSSIDMDYREEFLGGGIRLLQNERFRLGTDSLLLSRFVSLPKAARVADLGAGNAALGLLLCVRSGDCTVTGIELDPAAHALALENIRRNALHARVSSHLGDVREIRTLLPAGSFDCVLSNPPYFPAGSGRVSKSAPLARSEQTLTLCDVCRAAAWLLPTGGRFALIHRAERLCDVLCALRSERLEPKRIAFVRHRPGAPIGLVLVEARKDGKADVRFESDLYASNYGQEADL